MDDAYDKRCGEVFLTIKGSMVFHCTLCEGKYNGYETYAAHIKVNHNTNSNNDDIICDEISNAKIPQVKGYFLEGAEFKGCLDANLTKIDESNDYFNMLYLDDFEASSDADVKNTKMGKKEFNSEISEEVIESETTKMEAGKKASTNKTNPKSIVTAIIEIDSDSNAGNDKVASFVNPQNLQADIRQIRKKINYFADPEEERPHKCPYCAASFKNYSSFYKHKARHQTQKKHPCPQCSKTFYDPIDVQKHLKSHIGARPHLCSVCGKTFVAKDKLKDHMRRHLNQRDYECQVCKKAFFNSSLLGKHLLTHSKEKPFGCTICSAKFSNKKNLKQHLQVHENKRAYKCNLCDADFNQFAGLFSHRKTKHRLA